MASDLADVIAAGITGLGEIADPATVRHAATLLADHLWCVEAAPAAPAPWSEGVVEESARQAGRGQVLDLDDVHWAHKVHPGAIVWATVLHVGDGRPGRQWLRAAVAGYAVTVRLTAAATAEHATRFHVTATAGALGAVATGAVLVGADTATVATAVRHALSVAGGSRGALQDRSRATRVVHRAHAVRTGLGALAAALGGLPAAATADILTGGAFAAALPATLDPGTLLARPLDGTALSETRPRRIPSEPLDPVTTEGLAVKWDTTPAVVAEVLDRLGEDLSGVAPVSGPGVAETMAGLWPTRATSGGSPS